MAGVVSSRGLCKARQLNRSRAIATAGSHPMRPLLSVDRSSRLTARIVLVVCCLFASGPALAQGELKPAPLRLTLPVTGDPPGELCRRPETSGAPAAGSVSLHRTFHDDFDEHPLLNGKWAPHYAGGAAWPEARYWGGEGSDFRRKTSYNGEQQIYVDPRYGGRETTPLALDPFKIHGGILSIVASRTPTALKAVLFNNEYISGILTTQSRFSQKYGYFEMRAKVPVGTGVWTAFWMLADDGGWPPEVDIMEGRGHRPGDLVMTTHWRIPATQRVERCGFDFRMPDASTV